MSHDVTESDLHYLPPYYQAPSPALSLSTLSLSPLPLFVSDKWQIEAEEKEPVNEVAVLQPSRITSWPIAGFHMSYDQIKKS